MYEDSNPTCFDPNSVQVLPNDRFSQTNHHQICNPDFSVEEHLTYQQNHPQEDAPMALELQNQLNLEMDEIDDTTIHLMQEVGHEQPNWDYYLQEQNNGGSHQNQYSQTPDILNFFNIPRSTLLPNSSITFSNPTHNSGPSVLYDPVFQDGDGSQFDNGVFQDGDGSQYDDAVLEFRRGRDGKHTKRSEKQRRVDFNAKFRALRELVPNQPKVYI